MDDSIEIIYEVVVIGNAAKKDSYFGKEGYSSEAEYFKVKDDRLDLDENKALLKDSFKVEEKK